MNAQYIAVSVEDDVCKVEALGGFQLCHQFAQNLRRAEGVNTMVVRCTPQYQAAVTAYDDDPPWEVEDIGFCACGRQAVAKMTDGTPICINCYNSYLV